MHFLFLKSLNFAPNKNINFIGTVFYPRLFSPLGVVLWPWGLLCAQSLVPHGCLCAEFSALDSWDSRCV